MTFFHMRSIGFVAGLLVAGSSAHAQIASPPVLSAPVYSGNLQYDYAVGSNVDGLTVTGYLGSSNNPFTGQNISLSGSALSSASANATVSLAPSLSVSGSISGPAAASVADTFLQYQFEVVGPAASVPIFVTGSGSVNTTGVALSYSNDQIASLTISEGLLADTPGTTVNESIHGAGSWTLNGTYNFEANTIYTVNLYVEGYMVTDDGGSGSYSASVDPTFEITDPDYANLYSLDFSPGIENVATTPLPSSWTMMSSAFAFFAGLVLFRRKSVATA